MADPAQLRAETTVDAFHRGAFHLLQPAQGGHRAGMDAMVLAATVPDGASGRLADLGAGAGAAGLAAISRCPALTAVLVERSPVMAAFARGSLELEQNAHLFARGQVLEADVSLAGKARRQAGLADDAFDYVILNPPFNEATDRMTPDPLKAEAHRIGTEDMFERWLKTSGAILKPGGQVSVIARPQSLPDLLSAMKGRFGGLEITPLHPRDHLPAIRILVTAIKGSRARLQLRNPIVMHEGGGHAFAAPMDALNNGLASWPRLAAPRPQRSRA